MPTAPQDVVRELLSDPTNPETVRRLVASDATYVSLNFDNPELRQIMPWAGTRTGPEAVLDTYTQVGRFWHSEAFTIEELFGAGENVAVFGRFTYRSATLGKAVTSPFAILAKVSGGQITFMQFMEDTFGTASTFRSGGVAIYRSNPDGGEVGAVTISGQVSPRDVIERFYAAEAAYMNAGGADAGASFADMAATLDPDVVLHQSPDLLWGGEFRGHAGYEDWARQMSRAFDRLDVKDTRFFTDGDTVVITCSLVTRSRASGETLDLPMAQVVRVRGDRIIEFRPFYWNVPAYRQTVRSSR